jgi:MoaA/NifB/PqqE/SkfB family radical SAM enzyme
MRYGADMCPSSAELSAAAVERILEAIDQQIKGSGNMGDVLRSLDDGKKELHHCFGNYLGSNVIAKALTLKVLNLCLMKYQFLIRDSRLLCKPFGLLVDPCNGCNLACPGCVHSVRARSLNLFQWKSGMLPSSRMDAFFRRYGPRGIQTLFCNYGEPLLNGDTPRFISQAKRYLMRTSISTNMSIPRFDAEAYVASGLDFMILSIDGATQDTYARYRRNGDLRLVFRNIEALVKAKARMRKRTPVICWQYLAFTHNVHEVKTAAKICRDLGIDQFKVTRAFDVTWDDPQIQAADVKQETLQFNPNAEMDMGENWSTSPDDLAAEDIEKEFEATWAAGGVGEYGKIPRDVAKSATCHWLYKNVTMDAHGRVFPCAGAPKQGASFIFSELNPAPATDEPFNSRKHQRARSFFANRTSFGANDAPSERNDEPYCVHCDWFEDQGKTDIDNAQTEQYLRGSWPGLFSRTAREILCDW